MKEREVKSHSAFVYDEQGTRQVRQQVMDAYNSGVIGQTQLGVSTQEENDTI